MELSVLLLQFDTGGHLFYLEGEPAPTQSLQPFFFFFFKKRTFCFMHHRRSDAAAKYKEGKTLKGFFRCHFINRIMGVIILGVEKGLQFK